MAKKFMSLEGLREYDSMIKQEIVDSTNEKVDFHNSSTSAHSDIRNEMDIIKEDSYNHFYSTVYSDDGAHGLRFHEYEFELFQNGIWQKLPTPEPMTLAIDLSNSNPSTCCTYEEKASTMIAGSDEWDNFFGIIQY